MNSNPGTGGAVAFAAADKKLEGLAVVVVVLVTFAVAFAVAVVALLVVTFVICAADGTTRTDSNRSAITPVRTIFRMLINHPSIKLVQGIDIITRAALVG
ncbi:MAG: hypothetical protein ACXV5I_04540, partial [Halobacteriota archaeon]